MIAPATAIAATSSSVAGFFARIAPLTPVTYPSLLTTHAPPQVAIEVSGVEKTFRIPTQRVDSLKERLTTFSQPGYRELHALRDLSFEVERGEFFGIVGRNGSGKSTLLKILASIYAADAGRVRMAGRLAPFIELGVGFNNELTARENVELNGVMMGLTRRDARSRLDAVLEFAELRGVRRPQTEELLLRDARPPRLLDDDPVRRRDPADRRGAGGRRRLLPAEVRRRLLRDPRLAAHRRLRHPRHERGRAVLPPGDAAARRRHPRLRPGRRGGAQLPAAQLRAGAGRGRRRHGGDGRHHPARRLAGGRRGRADHQRREGVGAALRRDLRSAPPRRRPQLRLRLRQRRRGRGDRLRRLPRPGGARRRRAGPADPPRRRDREPAGAGPLRDQVLGPPRAQHRQPRPALAARARLRRLRERGRRRGLPGPRDRRDGRSRRERGRRRGRGGQR